MLLNSCIIARNNSLGIVLCNEKAVIFIYLVIYYRFRSVLSVVNNYKNKNIIKIRYYVI